MKFHLIELEVKEIMDWLNEFDYDLLSSITKKKHDPPYLY